MDFDKDQFLVLFGENIGKIRTEKKLSLRQLSQYCDIDHSDISKIEKGERNIQMSTILQLAKGLSKTPRELFDFDYEMVIYKNDK